VRTLFTTSVHKDVWTKILLNYYNIPIDKAHKVWYNTKNNTITIGLADAPSEAESINCHANRVYETD
jgi:hypothetical protein